jgi:hypothetical protein
MSSMDDINRVALALERELERFNARLKGAVKEVEKSHQLLKPLWDDEMGRDYEKSRQPLADAMERYNHLFGPFYQNELVQRLRHIQAYLHGTRR